MSETWQEREQRRMHRWNLNPAVYQSPPWEGEVWWTSSPVMWTHFAHASGCDPSKLAYTMNAEKGVADIQTRIKPGKYLNKYFGEGRLAFNILTGEWFKPSTPLPAILSSIQISHWASEYAKNFESFKLKVETTAEGIARAYSCGPRSCMTDKTQWIDGVERAVVEAYATGDIGVAWLPTPDGKGVRSRAVVNIQAKTFCTIYGDPPRFETALRESGFSRSPAALVGCRMHLMRIDGSDSIMLPWIDGESNVRLDGEYVVIDPYGDICCDSTEGAVGTIICESCRESCSENELCHISGVDQVWCESCRQDTFFCEHCELIFSDDNYGGNISDESWCTDCVTGDAFSCIHCENSYPDSEAQEIENEQWCENCASENFTNCESCDEMTRHGETRIVEVRWRHQAIQEEWCEGCIDDSAVECPDRDCEDLIKASEAQSDADGLAFCSGCIDAHRSTRERLRCSFQAAEIAFRRRQAHRRMRHQQSGYPLVIQ